MHNDHNNRYLSRADIEIMLRHGRAVEQFLGGHGPRDARQIRWLDLRVDSGRLCLTIHAPYDDGSEDFLDVYAFSEVSPDDEPDVLFFDTFDELSAHVRTAFGASETRWVNSGLVQDEYAAYVRVRDL